MKTKLRFLPLIILLALHATLLNLGAGVIFTNLVFFTDTNPPDYGGNTSPAAHPSALVLGNDGNFYGTTYSGGSELGPAGLSYGTVFQMTPNGGFTSLYSFDSLSADADGRAPVGNLIKGTDGAFYGATLYGGNLPDTSQGTIFRITSGGSLNTLYSFGHTIGGVPNADGGQPWAGLVQGPDGNFYGTTTTWGPHDQGTIFQFIPGVGLNTLHAFSATDPHTGTNTDGASPVCELVTGGDGNLYGATDNGGANRQGTIFRITPGGVFTNLHDFNAIDGREMFSPMVLARDGSLYGTTFTGGATASGTFFRITTNGQFTLLYTFGLTNAGPSGLIQASDGNFYGTTAYGGNSSGAGTMFQITTNGLFTALYEFSGPDGQNPNAPLVQAPDGSFYGTTSYGGLKFDPLHPVNSGYGTIFRLTTAAAAQTSIIYDPGAQYSATNNPNGAWSYGYENTLGGPFILYTLPLLVGGVEEWRITNMASGPPVIAYNPSTNAANLGTPVIVGDGFALHPGPANQYSTLRFTAPTQGLYQVVGAFFGEDVDGTTTDVHILTNGVSMMNGEVTGYGPHTGPSFDQNVSLNAGDYLDFAVGYGNNGSYFYDTTGLSLQVIFTGAGANTSTTPSNSIAAIHLDFDSVTAGGGLDATAYLGSFGITLGNVSNPGSVEIMSDTNFYGGRIVTASSPHNFLLQNVTGSPNGITYTLNFGAPLSSLSFTRIAIDVPSQVAQWTATAYAGTNPVGSVGEPFFSGIEAAGTYTLSGSGITSLTITASGQNSAGISSAPLDDFYLNMLASPAIVMNPPLIAANQLLLGFTSPQGPSGAFTLLQSPVVTGPWSSNTTAVLTTNAQSGGYLFTLPLPNSTGFYKIQSP